MPSELKKPSDLLIWVDIESNGLIPDSFDSCLFEISIVITNKQLEELAHASWVICSPNGTSPANWITNDFVLKMHSANGLLAACASSEALPIAQVQSRAIKFIRKHNAENSPLCGSSVHTDRKWLEHHCPDLVKLFHYRHLDASSVRLAAQSLGAQIFSASKSSQHRGLSDIRDSIQLTKLSIRYGSDMRAIWLHVKTACSIFWTILKNF